MDKLTKAEVKVLIAYAKNERNYQSMSLDLKLKGKGYLQWAGQKFSSGRFELSPKGEQALLAEGVNLHGSQG